MVTHVDDDDDHDSMTFQRERKIVKQKILALINLKIFLLSCTIDLKNDCNCYTAQIFLALV